MPKRLANISEFVFVKDNNSQHLSGLIRSQRELSPISLISSNVKRRVFALLHECFKRLDKIK